ncbi:hypothetical protein BD779DRAFT_1671412 [Infundibulicybe gibba]|nr:hypothetical protein BD779DRAFT_1671412 [Infundibulicybe gibba]
MSTCATDVGINLGPYAGVELLCTLFSMAFWVLGRCNLFLYFFNNPVDSRYFKLSVVWLWVMDTVHQCLLISGSYKATVTGQVGLIDNVRSEYVLQMLFTASNPTSLSSGILTPCRPWFPFPHKPSLVIGYGDSYHEYNPGIFIAQGIVFVHLNLKAQMGTHLTAPMSRAILVSNFAVGAAVDILLSAGLCFLLWKSYMEEGSSITQTNSMIHRLILFSINTGIWTALVGIATITMVIVYPNNFIYVGFYFILSPMYCNSLLANLNARTYLKGTKDNVVLHMTGIAAAPMGQVCSPSPYRISRCNGFQAPQEPASYDKDDIESPTLRSTDSNISGIQLEQSWSQG